MSITVVTVTLHEEGRNAESINDFFYRDVDLSEFPEPLGTGLRGLAAKFVREGKLLARYNYLLGGGDILRTVYVFSSHQTYREFDNHPVNRAAREIWKDRNWVKDKEVTPCEDFIDVATTYGIREE